MERLVLEAFGVTVAVTAPTGFDLAPLLVGLPPDYRVTRGRRVPDEVVEVYRDGTGFRVRPDNQPPHDPFTPELARRVAQGTLELAVAIAAPELVFVHAGVVAVDGRAVLVPGRTMAGKSTLTMALLEAGADYLSDEFAVLGPDALVRPYARPVHLRGGGRRLVPVDPARVPGAPVPVALVAALRYDGGAGWAVRPVSAGEAVLTLLDQTAPTARRPAQTLEVLARVCERAERIAGTRGEAPDAATRLIETARRDVR